MYIAPKGLFGRFFLITILPIILLQTISAYIFYERHWDNVSKHMETFLVGDFKTLLTLSEHNFATAQEIANNMGTNIKMHEDESNIVILDRLLKHSPSTKTLEDNIRKELPIKLKIIQKPNTPNSQSLLIFFWLKNGQILEVEFSKKRFISPTTLVFSLWLIGSAALLIIISLLFMRNQVKAIVNLAVAADKLGKGQEIKGFKPTGAREVKIAGKAFLNMKERMDRQINYRTEMLAHISHDLRTPLTRMRLLSALSNNKKLSADFDKNIIDMERLIHGYLEFAKEEGNEQPERFNFNEKFIQIINEFNNPNISYKVPSRKIIVSLRKQAIRRALINIISNSIKYAKQNIQIVVKKSRGVLVIQVDDDGPGIEPSKYNLVFQPFSQLDKSVNGYGLGLAIVKTIILGHGGNIKLSKSTLGGLRVIIKIPLRSLKWID